MNNQQDAKYTISRKNFVIKDKNNLSKPKSSKDYFAEIWDNKEDEIWNNL